MTIREAIRACIEEQGAMLDAEWLIAHVNDVVEDELAESGWVCDDESLEWSKPDAN